MTPFSLIALWNVNLLLVHFLFRNFTDYDIPIGNSAIECMAFNGTSFVNDPSFNGRAKEPLPMEPEYETLAYKPPQVIL